MLLLLLFLFLQHRLDVLGHLEWRFGLALDFLHGHAVGELNEGQAIGKVDVKDALNRRLIST